MSKKWKRAQPDPNEVGRSGPHFFQQNRRYILNALAMCAIAALCVGLYWATASSREADRVLQGLPEADRMAIRELSLDGQLMFAAGRPQTQEPALAVLTRRDFAWATRPETIHVCKLLAPDIERGTKEQKLAILKLVNKVGNAAGEPSRAVLAVVDPDRDVRAAGRNTITAVGMDLSAKSAAHDDLLARLTKQIESGAGGPSGLPDNELAATIRFLGLFRSNGASAVPLLMKIQSGDSPRAVTRAAWIGLDGIDPSWVERVEQPKLLARVVADLASDGEEPIEIAVRLLPRLGGLKGAALMDLVPLTCHPSEQLRDVAWKVSSQVQLADPEADAVEAVNQRLPNMLAWAAKADTVEAGGERLGMAVGLLGGLSKRLELGPFLLAIATGPPKARDVVLAAFDKIRPGWRESTSIQELTEHLEALLRYPSLQDAPPSGRYGHLGEVFASTGKAAARSVLFEKAWAVEKEKRREQQKREQNKSNAASYSGAYEDVEKMMFRKTWEYRWFSYGIDPVLGGKKPPVRLMSEEELRAYNKAFREHVTEFLQHLKQPK